MARRNDGVHLTASEIKVDKGESKRSRGRPRGSRTLKQRRRSIRSVDLNRQDHQDEDGWEEDISDIERSNTATGTGFIANETGTIYQTPTRKKLSRNNTPQPRDSSIPPMLALRYKRRDHFSFDQKIKMMESATRSDSIDVFEDSSSGRRQNPSEEDTAHAPTRQILKSSSIKAFCQRNLAEAQKEAENHENLVKTCASKKVQLDEAIEKVEQRHSSFKQRIQRLEKEYELTQQTLETLLRQASVDLNPMEDDDIISELMAENSSQVVDEPNHANSDQQGEGQEPKSHIIQTTSPSLSSTRTQALHSIQKYIATLTSSLTQSRTQITHLEQHLPNLHSRYKDAVEGEQLAREEAEEWRGFVGRMGGYLEGKGEVGG